MRILKALPILLLIAGCATASCSTIGSTALRDLPADWPPVGTTKAEVRARLGPPFSQSVMLQDGVEREAWGYHYAHAEMNPLLFVPVVGFVVAMSGDGVMGEGRQLVLTFDSHGKVSGRSISTTNFRQPQDPLLPADSDGRERYAPLTLAK